MTEKKGFSIRLKLLVALLISLVLAALVYYAVSSLGSFLVWRYFLGESDKQERAVEYVEKFQKYVTENKLTTDDAERISSWNPGGYVDFIVSPEETRPTLINALDMLSGKRVNKLPKKHGNMPL